MNDTQPHRHKAATRIGDGQRGSLDETGSFKRNGVVSAKIPQPLKLGDQIGRYILVDELGEGGFGSVWKAADDKAGRFVALKVPRASRLADADSLENFAAEVRMLGKLDHPHILPLYDYGLTQGNCFLVSKLAGRGTLEDRLNAARDESDRMADNWPSEAEAIEIVLAIADALQHAHSLEVYHRDIKPGNLFIDDHGRVLLGDFGLALHRSQQHVEEADIRGTVKYMSPEQALGNSQYVDARSDIYSLGVVFYELLSGRLPFEASDVSGYLKQVAEREVPPLRSFAPQVPIGLEQICFKCLALNMKERYSSATDLITELNDYQRQVLETTKAPTRFPDDVEPPETRRNVLKWLAGGVGIAAAAGFGINGLTGQWNRDPPQDPIQPMDVPHKSFLEVKVVQVRTNTDLLFEIVEDRNLLRANTAHEAIFTFGHHYDRITSFGLHLNFQKAASFGVIFGGTYFQDHFFQGYRLKIVPLKNGRVRLDPEAFRVSSRQISGCYNDSTYSNIELNVESPSQLFIELTFSDGDLLNIEADSGVIEFSEFVADFNRKRRVDHPHINCQGAFGAYVIGGTLSAHDPTLEGQVAYLRRSGH